MSRFRQNSGKNGYGHRSTSDRPAARCDRCWLVGAVRLCRQFDGGRPEDRLYVFFDRWHRRCRQGCADGAELALAEYNERGGYKGQKVETIIYDDETKPAKGVENLTRLITRDKVFAVVGPVNSGVALAIIDIAQKNQIPLMDTIATAEQIIQRYQNAPKNYIFRVSLNDGIQTSIMIDYIKNRNYQRIGLMHDSTGWGQSGRDTALRLLKEANLNLVAGPEVFDQNDSDMTAQLTR
jgi:branched-chain amino acid transport system substrate-binding protein